MRIAQISTCWLPTPPPAYGGTELVVSNLTESLVARGHDVTLFAPGDSVTHARLVSYYPAALGTVQLVADRPAELLHVLDAYNRAEGFDVIHDHTFPFGPAIGAQRGRRNVVHTLHVPFDEKVRPLYEMVGDRLHNVAISSYQQRTMPGLRYAAMIHHGIDVANYPFRSKKDDYLLFFGRMSPDKGAHTAVRVARTLGRHLVMVSKVSEPAQQEYFEACVKPLLTANDDLIAEVSFEKKGEVFAGAVCTLMPIEWHEPFGLVMIESLACGTPVVGFRKGSVPEIIDHGVTGFVADDLDGFISSVEKVESLDQAACRAAAQARFSTETMVGRYEALYDRVHAANSARGV